MTTLYPDMRTSGNTSLYVTMEIKTLPEQLSEVTVPLRKYPHHQHIRMVKYSPIEGHAEYLVDISYLPYVKAVGLTPVPAEQEKNRSNLYNRWLFYPDRKSAQTDGVNRFPDDDPSVGIDDWKGLKVASEFFNVFPQFKALHLKSHMLRPMNNNVPTDFAGLVSVDLDQNRITYPSIYDFSFRRMASYVDALTSGELEW